MIYYPATKKTWFYMLFQNDAFPRSQKVLLGSQNFSEANSKSQINRGNVVPNSAEKTPTPSRPKKNRLFVFFRNGFVSIHFLAKLGKHTSELPMRDFLGGLLCLPLRPPAQKDMALAHNKEIHAYPCYACPKIAL